MKIEASEGAYGEGGAVVCSEPPLLPAIAQDSSSIGLQQPGCGDGPFDCEHLQFIDASDAEDEEPPPPPAMSLKSLLKRGPPRGHGRSVTFDEAVTLFDGEGAQLLPLTTGPDLPHAAAPDFAFDPPIEYQDIEPPAEYRDPDEPEEEEPVPEEEEEEEPMEEDPPQPPEEEEEEPVGDKLIERFLEAEGVFPVDEELNSVFRELELGEGGQNGALDDTLFRNLISFLSNAEEIPLEAGDFFSSTKFDAASPPAAEEEEEDGPAHARTLSEADSDCSISSQDTIIVRMGEEEAEQPQGKVAERVKAFEAAATKPVPPPQEPPRLLLKQESFLDEVFSEKCVLEEVVKQTPPKPLPRESKVVHPQEEESLSRQSSGEQSVTDGPPTADADDSTSSDSRSGEVEEGLDDIGYDEEDAEDYDEESFRGMAHGNSKIRRIIKKNALQCSLFRGIEAKRRGVKYPRPKSPLLSQESLVEKLKWLTTVDEPPKEVPNFHSKQPPDVILSTGSVPVNGSVPHDELSYAPPPPHFYRLPGYMVRHDGGVYHPSLPRQPQRMQPQQHYPRMVVPPRGSLPRNFRDWRVIQRVMVGGRGGGGEARTAVPADHVRGAPPRDELQQFVERDSQRLDRIRKRYSVAEDDEDDPTFGFARRPSVRGVQQGGRGPMHIHRASVALTELPGNATIPYAHRKHPDPRYHSYAESMYGSTRTLPAKNWMMPPKDERGVPEGACSSPKISSDSLYHPPVVPDAIPPGGGPPHKDEGVIYYSLNV